MGVGEVRIPPWYVVSSFEDEQINFFAVNAIHMTEITCKVDEKSFSSFLWIVDRNVELKM